MVGDIGPGMQRDEDIRLARVDDFHIRTVALHQPSEGQRHVQIDGLLLRNGPHGSRIMTAMTGIDDQRKLLAGCCGAAHRQQHDTYKN